MSLSRDNDQERKRACYFQARFNFYRSAIKRSSPREVATDGLKEGGTSLIYPQSSLRGTSSRVSEEKSLMLAHLPAWTTMKHPARTRARKLYWSLFGGNRSNGNHVRGVRKTRLRLDTCQSNPSSTTTTVISAGCCCCLPASL